VVAAACLAALASLASAALPTLPATGNGITYRMGPVSEDPDTGLLTTYSCDLVNVLALQLVPEDGSGLLRLHRGSQGGDFL
jgi:hypothetical protein